MLSIIESFFAKLDVETWQFKIMLSFSWILLVYILLSYYYLVISIFARYRTYSPLSPVSILRSMRITHLFSRLWRYGARRCRGGVRLRNVISRSRTSLWPDGNNRRCVTQVRDCSSTFLYDIRRLLYRIQTLDINASSSVSKKQPILASRTGDFMRVRKVWLMQFIPDVSSIQGCLQYDNLWKLYLFD